MAFMVRGLLISSEETSDVSSAPGREVLKSCQTKLDGSWSNMKMRWIQKYCAPGLLLRFAKVGFSGSFGGFDGFGPMWQKPQDMPTRYGLMRSEGLSYSLVS